MRPPCNQYRARSVVPLIAFGPGPFDVCGDRETFLRHVLWACERIPEVIDRIGGFLFCVRYLCIQGGLGHAAC